MTRIKECFAISTDRREFSGLTYALTVLTTCVSVNSEFYVPRKEDAKSDY